MKDIEQAIALLGRRPSAADDFVRPSVAAIVTAAIARGYVVRGEL